MSALVWLVLTICGKSMTYNFSLSSIIFIEQEAAQQDEKLIHDNENSWSDMIGRSKLTK